MCFYHSSGMNPKRTGAASCPRTGRRHSTSADGDDATSDDGADGVVLVARIS